MLFFDTRDFGAAGNGTTDDTTAIQNAINAAGGAGKGGIVWLPRGVYKISSTLNVAFSDVTLRGEGAGLTPDNTFAGGDASKIIGSAATRLVWAGSSASNTAMLQFGIGLINGVWVNNWGGGAEDLCLDGAGVANTALGSLSRSRLHVRRVACVGYWGIGFAHGVDRSGHIANLSGGDNYTEDCVATVLGQTIAIPSGSAPPYCTALWLWGDGFSGNYNLSTFVRCSWFKPFDPSRSTDTTVVSVEQADSLTFLGCRWGGGQGVGLVLHSDTSGQLSTNGSQARTCVFIGCQGWITAKKSANVNGASTRDHIAVGYNMENVGVYPLIETGGPGPDADLTVLSTGIRMPVASNPGGGALLFGRAFPGLVAYSTAAQTGIVANTWSRLQWNQIVDQAKGQYADPFLMYPGGTVNSFTVPANTGLKWARVHVQLWWSPSVTAESFRYLEIRQNNSVVGFDSRNPLARVNCEMSCISRMFRVTGGDVIDVWAQHNAPDMGGLEILCSPPGNVSTPVITIEFT